MTTCHTYTINYKYRYVCVGANLLENGERGPADAGRGCGAEIGRHSKSINVQTQVGERSSAAACVDVFFFALGKSGRLRYTNGFLLACFFSVSQLHVLCLRIPSDVGGCLKRAFN